MGRMAKAVKTLPIEWDAPTGGRWQIVFRLLDMDGRAECVGMDIRCLTSDGREPMPLRAKTLKALDFAGRLLQARRITAAAAQDLGELVVRKSAEPPRPRSWQSSVSPERAQAMRERLQSTARLLTPNDGTKAGRRARRTRDDLERVAAVYRDAYAQGEAPAKAVAVALDVSDGNARKLVHRCRGLGLLPPAEAQGIAGWARSEEEGDEE